MTTNTLNIIAITVFILLVVVLPIYIHYSDNKPESDKTEKAKLLWSSVKNLFGIYTIFAIAFVIVSIYFFVVVPHAFIILRVILTLAFIGIMILFYWFDSKTREFNDQLNKGIAEEFRAQLKKDDEIRAKFSPHLKN